MLKLIVSDGQSSFIVNSAEEAIKAVEATAYLDRRKVRRYFDPRFTADHMASDYVKAYETLLCSFNWSKLDLVEAS